MRNISKGFDMEEKKPVYALYKGAVVCEVLDQDAIAATVRFDNGEKTVVMTSDLQFNFDLNEGNEE